MPEQPHESVVRHFADHRRVEVPLLERPHDFVFASALRDDEHPLLRLAEHDLVRRHPAFAHRHAIELQPDARAGAPRHLERRRRESGRAHVLDALDRAISIRVGVHDLETRLEQKFFRERIADLHGRTFLFRRFIEFRRRHRRAVNAVASRFRADVDHGVADAARRPFENFLALRDAEGKRVDEDVAVVRRVERRLAADRRDADAVAVAADAAHDTVDEILHARRVELAESQGVETRDRTRAHRENVAQDSADAGRRALIRLDERRVIVRFHLERGDVAVADVDHARVLAGTLHDARSARRKIAQMHAR